MKLKTTAALALALSITGTCFAAPLSMQETMDILDGAGDGDSGYWYIRSVSDAASYLSRYSNWTDEDGNTHHVDINPAFTNASAQGMLNLVANYPEYIDKYASKNEWKSLYVTAAYNNVSAGQMGRDQLLARIAKEYVSKTCSANSLQSAAYCLVYNSPEGGASAFFSAASGDHNALAYIEKTFPEFAAAYETSAEKAITKEILDNRLFSELQSLYGKTWSTSDANALVQAGALTELGNDETAKVDGGSATEKVSEGKAMVSSIEQAVKAGTCEQPNSIASAAECIAKTDIDNAAISAYSANKDSEILAYIAAKNPELFAKFATADEAASVSTTQMDEQKVEAKIASVNAQQQSNQSNQQNSAQQQTKQQPSTETENKNSAENNGSSSAATTAGAAAGGVALVAAGAAAVAAKKTYADDSEDEEYARAESQAALSKFVSQLDSDTSSASSGSMASEMTSEPDEEEPKKEKKKKEPKATPLTPELKKQVERIQKSMELNRK